MTGSAKLRIAGVLASALLLAGCFDIAFDIDLKSDGSGTIAAKTVLSRDMSKLAKEDKGKSTPELLAKDNKAVTVTRSETDGRLTTGETLAFRRLSDVSLDDSRFEVIDLGRTIYGVDRSHIRFVTGGESDRKGGREPSEKSEIVTSLLKGYFYTLTLHVPCNVGKASSPKISGTAVAPNIQTSFWHGSTVQWKLPMELFFAAAGKRQVFEVECWSWFGIPAGKTK
jgi:hypothetical protein